MSHDYCILRKVVFSEIAVQGTKKITDPVPVVLVGRKYWSPLVRWIKQELLVENEFISPEDLDIFHLCDTPEEAFEIVKATQERFL